MGGHWIQIVYRQGKPFAAYLYLDRRNGEKVARTERHGSWLVDFAAEGRVMGIEFTSVSSVNLSEINRILTAAHQPALLEADLAPLAAA